MQHSIDVRRPLLVLSDLQIPFHAAKGLEFASYVARHYQIPSENVLCVGDEVDNLHGGSYPKDPDGTYTPRGELATTRLVIEEWGKVFPQMKLCISNHGVRWAKKATAAEIPSELMRKYEDIIGAPRGWIWKEQWRFDELKHPFRMIHGMGYSGMNGHRTAALDGGMSTVIGHLHSHAGIAYIKTSGQNIWGFNVGSLIDPDAYAFKYGRDSRFKPCLGVGVIMQQGKMPLWIPYE